MRFDNEGQPCRAPSGLVKRQFFLNCWHVLQIWLVASIGRGTAWAPSKIIFGTELEYTVTLSWSWMAWMGYLLNMFFHWFFVYLVLAVSSGTLRLSCAMRG